MRTETMMRCVVMVLVLVLAAVSPAAAQEPSPAATSQLPIGDYQDNAIVLDEMVEGLVAIEQRPWEALAVHPDGRTIDIYFLGTDPSCTKLHDLDVAVEPTGLEIVIITGQPADVGGCREPLLHYVVTVKLEQAFFGGGSTADGS